MKFSAKISGDIDLDKLKFHWTVDKGKITEGQGTDTIIVESGDEYDVAVTATVYVSDKKNCDLSASESGIIVPLCVLPDLIDEFGDIPEEDIRARFDNMFIRLQNAPEAKAAVINYGSDKAIQARVELLNNHIKLRGYDKNKIIIKNGGKEETIRTRIWLVPEGVDPDVFN